MRYPRVSTVVIALAFLFVGNHQAKPLPDQEALFYAPDPADPALVAASGLKLQHNRYVPKFTLEQITQLRTLGQFSISPDGTKVAYTLVGYYFGWPVIPRFGEDDNVRVVWLETGEIRRMTSGGVAKTKPRFSPSGDRIAFERDGDIWVVEVATGAARRVTVHLEDDRDAAWSPDGKKLAFVSIRGGKTDLWVVSAAGERHGLVRLTDDAVNKKDPQWSPDGRTIVFSGRHPDDHLYASGIFSVPSAGGPVTRLTPVDAATNLSPRWSPAGRRLAFLSDRSGYVHVWTMTLEGKEMREFDTGPYDSFSPHFVVQPVWDHDGRRILLSVNRHGSFDLVVIDVATGQVRTVGTGGGQYHEVGWRRDGSVVYAYENAWSPRDLFVKAAGAAQARQLTFSSHAAFRKEHFAEVRRVSVRSFDGLELGGFLLTPGGLRPGQRLPAILNLHPNSYGQFYDHWNPFAHYLVQSGYVILMGDQRGSAGYGRAFRETSIGAWGTKTLQDVKAMAAFLKSQPFVDPERVGVMGLSQGGWLSLLALTKEPDLFRAGIDLMGPADRRSPFINHKLLPRGWMEFHIGAGVTEQEDPELYRRVSPVAWVEHLRAPLLIIHSDRDPDVAPGMTYNLVDELERQHKAHEVMIYPGEGHGLADPAHQLDSYRRILSFLDRHLKP